MDQKSQQKRIYLDDTIETFIYEKQALQFKLQHNINELSSKNVFLTTVLKQLTSKQYQSIEQQTKVSKEIVNLCLLLQDDLACLDALQKKTDFLKLQAEQLQKCFEDEPSTPK